MTTVPEQLDEKASIMLNEPLCGVVVSVGFSDYLEYSLLHNRPLLDSCVVVTTPDDVESQRLAGKYACDLLVTEDGQYRDGETRAFNKGVMIERGLQQLPGNSWRVHWDADILFPGNIRQRLEVALYDKKALYSCDRMNFVGWDSYQDLLATGWATRGFEYHHFLSYPLAGADVGARLVYHDQGWVPIGFFQLWHSSVEHVGIYRVRTYPVGSETAAHDDVQFALRWDRKHRILIPEFLVAHLVTKDMRHGTNWKGRKSERFGPPDDKTQLNRAAKQGKNRGASC